MIFFNFRKIYSPQMGLKFCSLIYKFLFAWIYYLNFIIHLISEWADKNNWFLKLQFSQTAEEQKWFKADAIKKIMAWNLLIYLLYLHSIRRLSWSATTLATLIVTFTAHFSAKFPGEHSWKCTSSQVCKFFAPLLLLKYLSRSPSSLFVKKSDYGA